MSQFGLQLIVVRPMKLNCEEPALLCTMPSLSRSRDGVCVLQFRDVKLDIEAEKRICVGFEAYH